MTAVIPREGIIQRIEALKAKRAEIDAQITENETWLRVLDDVEATTPEAPQRPSRATKQPRSRGRQ